MRTVCPRSEKSFVHEDLVPLLVGGPYTIKIVTFCMAWSQEVPFFLESIADVEGVGSSSCEFNLIFSFSKIILFPEKKFYLHAWIMVYGLKALFSKALISLRFIFLYLSRCHFCTNEMHVAMRSQEFLGCYLSACYPQSKIRCLTNLTWFRCQFPTHGMCRLYTLFDFAWRTVKSKFSPFSFSLSVNFISFLFFLPININRNLVSLLMFFQLRLTSGDKC